MINGRRRAAVLPGQAELAEQRAHDVWAQLARCVAVDRDRHRSVTWLGQDDVRPALAVNDPARGDGEGDKLRRTQRDHPR